MMRRFWGVLCRDLSRPRRCFTASHASQQLSSSESYTGWPSTVFAYADGACRGNPGRSGCGALLVDPSTGQVLASDTKYVGDQETNNVAEYHGLLLALQLSQRYQVSHVHVHMDSQLIVRQMQGVYRVKAPNLISLYQECKKLSASLPQVTFAHVVRAENSAADQLANKAIDDYDTTARHDNYR